MGHDTGVRARRDRLPEEWAARQRPPHREGAGADDNVLDALERIPDREYDGPTAVSETVAS